ncbi:zinc finger rna-binding hypothetical protein [Limosa lapponica baueri]|uniref:Zinc finger RNA-binding protein n=1 Tax=Limosa lapponica baueri TaxID=1758121 RepID=A0A2I0TU95_LIMLA|nr:zinc finger rna-binding hypothetical protein [Limosa lapponica baueri]
MGDSVKSLAEVKVDDICCSPLIQPSSYNITEGYQIGQARFTLGKSMLTTSNNFLFFNMFGDDFQNKSLHYLPKDRGEANWPVVSWVLHLALFEDWSDICLPPVLSGARGPVAHTSTCTSRIDTLPQQPASGVAYSHPTTVASYTVHQAPVAAHTVTAAYAPAAATVAVARPAPVAVAAAATAAAYGGYPTAHTATDYGYTQRQQEAPPPPPPVTTQNYQDSYSYVRSTAPAVAYDSKQYYQQPTATAAAVAAAAQPQPSVAESYYQTGTSYSGYEAAVYSAASSYYQQQQQQQKQAAAAAAAAAATAAWTGTTFTKKAPFQNKQLKPKQPPKPPQIHYCDVCKISCAGPQTYKEHLEGQKHKKKEAALKASQNTNNSSTSARGTQNQLRCELCDVSCTGADAYAAHIRGAKHQKVVKLHTKLGKPIPSTEPNVVTQATSSTSTSASKPTASASNIATSSSTVNSSVASSAVKILTPTTNTPLNTASNNKTSANAANIAVKKISTPKINFVGGNKLQTTGSKLEEMKSAESVKATPAATVQTQEVKPDTAAEPVTPTTLAALQSDVQPVGHDYVEEVRNDEGKVIRFHCKLCECSFNDPNAKEMHLKGRRHRLQYKVSRNANTSPLRRPDSSDDRYVMTKHAAIYPTEEELQAVQKIVSITERALKLVSDNMTDHEKSKNKEGDDKKDGSKDRALKGVLRVGVLAKGLLLRGDRNVNLVLLCAEKPSKTLLSRIAESLPKQLAVISPEKYDIKCAVPEAAIILNSCVEPKMQVTITLTSPVIREENMRDGGGQLVLQILTDVQSVDWTKSETKSLKRIYVEAMELLVEKAISSATGPQSPGDALRRVFECISSGIILKGRDLLLISLTVVGGPGLLDPCEKDPFDTLAVMTDQQREDITSSAQDDILNPKKHRMIARNLYGF